MAHASTGLASKQPIKVNSMRVNTPKQAQKIIKKTDRATKVSAAKNKVVKKLSNMTARLEPKNYDYEGRYKGKTAAEHKASTAKRANQKLDNMEKTANKTKKTR